MGNRFIKLGLVYTFFLESYEPEAFKMFVNRDALPTFPQSKRN